MELRHLRYYIAVAECLNFRKAASRLKVSQTALTTQLKDLEAELGLRLMERDTRGVSALTEGGKLFLNEAHEIVKRADGAVNLMRNASKGAVGRLAVGSVGALSAGFIAPGIARYRTQYPKVAVSVVALGMVDHISGLESREIDVGFTMGPRDPFPATIDSKYILTSPLRLFMAADHPLAAKKFIPLSALTTETYLALCYNKRPSLMLKQCGQILANHRVPMGPSKVVEGFEAYLTSLASGAGVTLLPEIALPTTPAGIVSRPFSKKSADLTVELRALFRVNETSRIVHNFLSVISEC